MDETWIPLKTIVKEHPPSEDEGLTKALERYHSWDKRDRARDTKELDPETLGRFVHHCVVIAGPGMGKSTLIKKLARTYARDGYPTLPLRLPILASRMRHAGSSFVEGIFALGLDGSGVSLADIAQVGVQQWVLLCDGLDECGANQELICHGLLNFVAGHPQSRVIVTTRPIGTLRHSAKNGAIMRSFLSIRAILILT